MGVHNGGPKKPKVNQKCWHTTRNYTKKKDTIVSGDGSIVEG